MREDTHKCLFILVAERLRGGEGGGGGGVKPPEPLKNYIFHQKKNSRKKI